MRRDWPLLGCVILAAFVASRQLVVLLAPPPPWTSLDPLLEVLSVGVDEGEEGKRGALTAHGGRSASQGGAARYDRLLILLRVCTRPPVRPSVPKKNLE